MIARFKHSQPIGVGAPDAGLTLHLLQPCVRLAAPAPTRRRSFYLPPAAWTCTGQRHWCWQNAWLGLDARIASAAFPATLTLGATAQQPVQVEYGAFELAVACAQRPWFIDQHWRWRRLRHTATIGQSTPLVVRWPLAHTQAELRCVRGAAYQLVWKQGWLLLRAVFDAAALHPRWQFTPHGPLSTAAPTWQPGQCWSISLRVAVCATSADTQPVVVGRYPAGAEAVVSITDHCDFDTVETLTTLLHGDGCHQGWLGRGLRMTKGVFAIPSPNTARATTPTLHDQAYSQRIQRLCDDGSTVAPHAFNELGNLDHHSYQAACTEITTRWAPRTWIDHGTTLRHCYTMGGADLDRLKQVGFTTLWAYHDVNLGATPTLNLLTPAPRRRRAQTMVWHMLRHLWHGEVLISAHYGRSLVYALVWSPLVPVLQHGAHQLRRVLHQHRTSAGGLCASLCAAWRSTLHKLGGLQRTHRRQPHTEAELIAAAPTVYPERGVPLNNVDADELLLFATVEVVHVQDTYTGSALQRLLNERGLHIGHCYLLNRLPYIAGVFVPASTPPQFAPAWADFVTQLAALVAARRVWNPPVSELAAWMRQMQHITLTMHGAQELHLTNALAEPVRGVTLLLPRNALPHAVVWAAAPVVGWRYWHDWLAVWGDLPAQSTTTIRWHTLNEQTCD